MGLLSNQIPEHATSEQVATLDIPLVKPQDLGPLPCEGDLQHHETKRPCSAPGRLDSGSEPNHHEEMSDPEPETESLSPESLKERLIEVRLDIMRMRSRVIYKTGQADATALLCGMESDMTPLKGFHVFDGYDQTWYVSIDCSEPIDPSHQGLADSIRKRQLELQTICRTHTDDETHSVLFTKASALIEHEVATTCQDEWDHNKDKPLLPPAEWVRVKQGISDGSQLIDMVAKTRLISGKALLLGYYRAKVLELTIDGKFSARDVTFPVGLQVATFCERLDAWFPPDHEHNQQAIDAVRKKLNIVVQNGTEVGKNKAQCLLKELDESFYHMEMPGNERKTWSFGLFAKEDYAFTHGQGPEKPDFWTKLHGDEAFAELEGGRLAGKHAVMVRVSHNFPKSKSLVILMNAIALEDPASSTLARS